MNRYMARLQLVLALCAALLLGSGAARAGQFEQFGDYQVHYSIFPSSFLSAEVASRYDIVRSQSIGIVNVSILRLGEQGRLEPVSGQVEGQVVNDIQQRRILGFRRISEGDAVYYIAQFPFSEGELLTFELQANAPGAPGNMPVRVAQTLMND
ncbi:DUF4426 domain-containing protein [Marinobacter sp. R17]|uniref:DUF4426 domain-containing protein n=1 Tax=Marinobacter TaxID=2742 RepID=UPI000F4C71EA|nr:MULTISPECIES: DUF4426 domain-containing protein [Marinobacter]ROT94740.1 DUF4426 domain-containing protein [Marinobacter sp. R17]